MSDAPAEDEVLQPAGNGAGHLEEAMLILTIDDGGLIGVVAHEADVLVDDDIAVVSAGAKADDGSGRGRGHRTGQGRERRTTVRVDHEFGRRDGLGDGVLVAYEEQGNQEHAHQRGPSVSRCAWSIHIMRILEIMAPG